MYRSHYFEKDPVNSLSVYDIQIFLSRYCFPFNQLSFFLIVFIRYSLSFSSHVYTNDILSSGNCSLETLISQWVKNLSTTNNCDDRLTVKDILYVRKLKHSSYQLVFHSFFGGDRDIT